MITICPICESEVRLLEWEYDQHCETCNNEIDMWDDVEGLPIPIWKNKRKLIIKKE